MKCKYVNAFIGNRWLKTWQYPLAKEKNDIAGSHRAAVTYTFCAANGKLFILNYKIKFNRENIC